ncbi:MAG: methionyl-tRNA formyltransferase [Bdellovibrionales bacterium]|nr:methionyl-tRNA formyltransferase [Bdellovibrionales bacterium]
MAISVLYFGTPDFAVPALRALVESEDYSVEAVITQPDKPAGRGKKLSPSPVKKYALSQSIPVLQPAKLKKEWAETKEALLKISPSFDVGIVCAFGQILKSECLQFPKHGCINIHASLLPRWRGAAPIQRAIMSGDTKTGISLMQMDEGLDTGPWYVQEELKITPSTTTMELHDSLAELGGQMLVKHLKEILLGNLPQHTQDEYRVTYADKIDKNEALLDWSQPAEFLAHKIQGLSPFPGAFTFLHGQRLKLLRARSVGDLGNSPTLTPGSLCRVESDKLEVQCGSGVLSIEELQLAGKGRLSTREFLKGIQLSTGFRLTESAEASDTTTHE